MKNRLVKAAAILSTIMLTVSAAPMNVLAKNQADSYYTQIPGTMLYVTQGAAANAATHTATYCQIPFNILVKMTADNCKIYLDTLAEEGSYIGGVASGAYTQTQYKIVGKTLTPIAPSYVEIISDYSVAHKDMSLVHEIGHYVDDKAFGGPTTATVYQLASTQPTWTDIYTRNAAAVASMGKEAAANAYDPAECFAEAFAWYVKAPATLQKAAPEVFNYIAAAVASIQ